jgi:hypothetical protein
MKKHLVPSTAIFSLLLLIACAVSVGAQNREKFVISAKAGGVNAVTGQAVHAKGGSDWQQLTVTDDLDAGDRVRTASDGRVEILLNPGSYLRIGGDSEFELADNSLANLEVKLLKGTAIVEAAGFDGVELLINITTPHTKLAIVRGGLYRLNVMPSDGTELIVRKGRVILGNSHTKVKGGNKVVFSATSTAIAKLTKEEKKKSLEDVEVWSRDRAEELAKANRRITERMMNSAFASMSGYSSFSPRTLGFWFFSSTTRCYTFLPLFYGWGSPYGSSYHTSIYYGPRGFGMPGYSYPTSAGSSLPSSNPGSGSISSPGGAAMPASRSAGEGASRISSKVETATRQP